MWKRRKENRVTTLQSRLVLLVSLLVFGMLLLFTVLLFIFGFNGNGHKAIKQYIDTEISNRSKKIQNDMGFVAATGIQMSQQICACGEELFKKQGLTCAQAIKEPENVQALIQKQLPILIDTAQQNTCGGTFIILDASVSPQEDGKRAGFFLKKNQPISTTSVRVKNYCLRGSATIARENHIELLGQWKMEYDEGELDFYNTVIDTAKAHSDLPLSRLYYWTERIRLQDNIDSGMLLCVPLIDSNGECFGACGIEVSDRMFKLLYSPNESDYHSTFTALTPIVDDRLYTDRGLIAGNSFLAGKQMDESLIYNGEEHGFSTFACALSSYGGMNQKIRFYPSGSPYEDMNWSVAVLMPLEMVDDAVEGDSLYVLLILLILLTISFVFIILMSSRYVSPIKQGFETISKLQDEEQEEPIGILEIDNLLEDVSNNIRMQQEEISRLTTEKQTATEKYEQAKLKVQQAQSQIQEAQSQMNEAQNQIEAVQSQIEKAHVTIERLTDKRKQDIDPDEYEQFLDNLKELTATEQKIFQLYMEGKTTKEILQIQNISDNTLKYHNRNIYSKLGVSSRKQLLQYATIMQKDM